MTATPVVQRIVPGAPPSIELSKSQRKKRKAAKADDPQSPFGAEASPTDRVQEHAEANETAYPPGLVSRAESQAPPLSDEDPLLKPSPIVDLMNKRFKAMTKKIARISTYAATDIEKLNDDQVRSLKNLPTLEAIQKEIGEVKKAIETHELEIAQELAAKRLEAEKAEKARVSNAVSDAEAFLFTRFNDVLNMLRVNSLLASGALDLSSLADPSEISALFTISNILIGEPERTHSIVEQIVRGVGDFEGTSYTRLLAITQQALNPPSAPSPVPEESEDEEQSAPPSVNGAEEDQPPVTGVPNANTMTGSFQFIQQSELEAASFEGTAEWVDAAVHGSEVEGETDHAEPAPATSDASENGPPLDWAADEEGGLPPIAGLQAEFGNSGSATPAEAERAAAPVEGAAATETGWPAYGEASANGDVATPVEGDHDGFTPTRGRARGRAGFRGERGFRGGRGGERGAYRGGDRGFKGGRGGERGGFRGGRGGSEWRGDERTREGDGERGVDSGADGERGDGDRHREGGRGRGFGRGRGGEGGRGRGEDGRRRGGDRGRGGEGRGRGGERRGGRGDRGGHHHEASPIPA